MKTIRRHWPLMSGVFALLLLAGAWWWHGSGTSSAQADPPYAPLTEAQRGAIRLVQNDLSLDRDALLALNPNSSQAESLLSAVRSWCLTNQASLSSLRATIDEKAHHVRQKELAIARGPYDSGNESALALAREELVTARASYRSALAGLATSVNELLSTSQRTTWAAIMAGHGQTMPLRMLALSDPQRLDLGRAEQAFRRRSAAASGSTERETVWSAWQTALNDILTAEQETVVSAYQSGYAAASQAVAGAIETVLATG